MAQAVTLNEKDVADDLLLDYASGALPEAVSILVATHIALRPDLRAQVSDLEAIGGRILDEMEPAALSDNAFDAVLAEIDLETEETEDPETGTESATGDTGPAIPEPLRSYLGRPLDDLAWRKRGPGIEEYRLPVADTRFEVSVLRLQPGRSVPTHSHGGDELTLVLDGAFTDVSGRYGRGDLAINGAEDHHAPLADDTLGCICLAVTGGPLKFSNPLIGLYDRLTRN